MDHWQRVLPLSIHTVRDESLVNDPEPHIRQLVAHCDLKWDDRCLAVADNKRAVRTVSKWQVRQPIYSSSVARWKRFEKHLATVRAELSDLIGNMG